MLVWGDPSNYAVVWAPLHSQEKVQIRDFLKDDNSPSSFPPSSVKKRVFGLMGHTSILINFLFVMFYFIYSFVHLFIYLYIHLFVRLFLSVYLFIFLFVYFLIYLLFIIYFFYDVIII